MAVEASSKRVIDDFDDDDDKPLVFRGTSNSSISKKNQLFLEIKKSSSSNVQTSNLQRSKVAPSAKVSPPSRSPLASPKPSEPSAEASPVKSPAMVHLRVSASLDDQSKHSAKQNAFIDAVKRVPNSDSDREDSEDDKSFSARLKRYFNSTSKGLSVSPSVKGLSEDSDDEVPLSSKFSMKSSAGSLGSKFDDYEKKKSSTSRIQQNGSVSKEKQQKSVAILSKRSLDKMNSSDQSSAKKAKLLDTTTPVKIKQVTVKAEGQRDEDGDISISQRLKKSVSSDIKSSSTVKKVTKFVSSSPKKISKNYKKVMKNSKYSKSTKVSPSSGDGQKKWTTLAHSGVIFPPPYKPHGIKMLYKGQPVDLTPAQEEVATMYAVMRETDYYTKPKFQENFWNDWREILGRNHVIQNLKECDFTPINEWHLTEKEKKRQMSSEEKKALKEEKLKQEENFMWAIVDGVKGKVGNFRVEPPGLFRGRGEHPKMGKLKRRIRPSDITINIGKHAPIPECPIPGERWKEVKHDNTVRWLAFWNDPINPKEFKYVFLAASSSLKGQSDKEKYEKSRNLKDYVENIRAAYTKDFTSKDVTRQRIAVATYLIDKLALRAGNEKVGDGVYVTNLHLWVGFLEDDDEADTVGCCSLKVGNVECIEKNKLKEDMELLASACALFSEWDQLKAAPCAAQTPSPIESPDSLSTHELKEAIDNYLLILSMDLDTAAQPDNLSVLNEASLTFSKVSTSHISLGHRTMLTGLHIETQALLERGQMLNAKTSQLHIEKAQHDRLSFQVDANQFDFQKLSDELSAEDLELSTLQKQLAELQQKIEDCKTRKILKRQVMAKALAQTKPLIAEFQKLRSQGDPNLALAQTEREKRRLNSEWAKLRDSFILFQEGLVKKL